MKSVKILMLSAVVVFCMAAPSLASPAVNPDFETGDLTGWTVFDTGGAMDTAHYGNSGIPMVVVFDTTGGGASNSAQFQVGSTPVAGVIGIPFGGGGIYQNIWLNSGELTFNADIALNNPFLANNIAQHLFYAYLDAVQIAYTNLGSILAGETKRGVLSGTTTVVTPGSHILRLKLVRNATASALRPTPYQYVDGILLSGPATIPEPASFLLFSAGVACAAFVLKRRKV